MPKERSSPTVEPPGHETLKILLLHQFSIPAKSGNCMFVYWSCIRKSFPASEKDFGRSFIPHRLSNLCTAEHICRSKSGLWPNTVLERAAWTTQRCVNVNMNMNMISTSDFSHVDRLRARTPFCNIGRLKKCQIVSPVRRYDFAYHGR